MPETMLETIANIVTILGLGTGIVYSSVKLTRAAWRRIRPVLVTRTTISGIAVALMCLITCLGILISFGYSVRQTAVLFDRVHKIADRVDVHETDIDNLQNRLSQFDSLNVQIFGWEQGRPAERMIPMNQGICYLTYVGEKFEGRGQSASIIQQDGHWYLTGYSLKNDVKARAACWKFAEK